MATAAQAVSNNLSNIQAAKAHANWPKWMLPYDTNSMNSKAWTHGNWFELQLVPTLWK